MCIGWPMQVLSSAQPAELSGVASDRVGAPHAFEIPAEAPAAPDAPDACKVAAPASARALVRGRGRLLHVDLRLVGPCAPGDWVLVHQGAARERLDAVRAAEIHAALDLLEQGLAGVGGLAEADPGFDLPSAMSAAQLAALTRGSAGAAPATPAALTPARPALAEPSPERP